MAFQYMHILAVDWWNMWSLCSWLWRTDLRNLCLSYKPTTHLIMIELRVCLVYKSKRAKHLLLTWTTFSSHKFQPVIDKYAAIDYMFLIIFNYFIYNRKSNWIFSMCEEYSTPNLFSITVLFYDLFKSQSLSHVPKCSKWIQKKRESRNVDAFEGKWFRGNRSTENSLSARRVGQYY